MEQIPDDVKRKLRNFQELADKYSHADPDSYIAAASRGLARGYREAIFDIFLEVPDE